MAKGVAAITMDEEYQQKRREAMNKQPSGLREGLTRGGKGLVSVCTTLSVFIIFLLLKTVHISRKHTFDTNCRNCETSNNCNNQLSHKGLWAIMRDLQLLSKTVMLFFSGICQWDHRDCYQTY